MEITSSVVLTIVIIAVCYFIWRSMSTKPREIERRIEDKGREFRKDVTTQWDKYRK